VLCHTYCIDICWTFRKYTAYILWITEVKIVKHIIQAFITNTTAQNVKLQQFIIYIYLYIYKQYQKAQNLLQYKYFEM